MSLYQQINIDMVTAMKARDAERLSVLRMLQSALKNEAINLTKPDLTDEEVFKIIKSEIKKRKDSESSYQSGGRNDLADKENMEARLLESYLPAQLEDADLIIRIEEILATMPEDQKSNFGKAMGQVVKEIGLSADGNRVRAVLQEKLGK